MSQSLATLPNVPRLDVNPPPNNTQDFSQKGNYKIIECVTTSKHIKFVNCCMISSFI